MEVRIGVQNASRELSIDTAMNADEVEAEIGRAVSEGGLLTLSDARGRRIVIPADKLAYVDITTSVTGQVGFRG